MRKNATKIAAVVMSLALTLTSVNIPTSTASAASKAKLNTTKATLYVSGPSSQKSTKLKVTVNGKKKSATFTSSNTKVAKVNKNGKVTAKKKGKATIKATYNGKTYKCKVTVKKYKYVTSVSVDTDSVSLAVGETQKVAATVAPAKATVTTLKYTSSDKTVAKVNQKGKITAVAAGTATITVKATDGSNKKATIAVTVTAASSDDSTATTAPSEETASPDAEATETPAEATTLGEFVSLTATKADTLTAVFDSAVPTDATVTVTNQYGEVSGKTAISDTTITFTGTANFSEDTYTMTVSYGDASKSESVDVVAEYVAEIKILNDVALTATSDTGSKDNDLAYVYYEVYNQYGESLKETTTISWTVSSCDNSTPKVDKANGKLTLEKAEGFTYGTLISVVGVYTKTGLSVNAQVTIGLAQAIDTLEFAGFVSTDAKTTLVDTLPADFAKDTWYLLYTSYDQNGNKMDASDSNIADKLITFTADAPLLVDSTTFTDGSIFTINSVEYSSVLINPGTYVDKGGEVNITAISTKTGKNTVHNFVIGTNGLLASLTLSVSGTVTDGDEVTLDYVAKDTDGNTITNYETIVRSSNTLSLKATEGTIKISESSDGTAKITWTDIYDYDSDDTDGRTNVYAQKTSYDEQDRYISLTTIVVGGESNNYLMSVSDARKPSAIKSVTFSNVDSVDTIVEGYTAYVYASQSVAYLDQYGTEMAASSDAVKSFFNAMESDGFGGYYYALKASTSDNDALQTNWTDGKTETLASGNELSTEESGWSSLWKNADDWSWYYNDSIAFTGISDDPEEANVSWSLVKIGTDAEDLGDIDAWESVSKSYKATYTVVGQDDVSNLSITDPGKVQIVTEASDYSNGETAGLTDKIEAKVATGSAADLTLGGESSWWGFQVQGTYKGTTLTMPYSSYSVADDSQVSFAENYYNEYAKLTGVSGAALCWNDLYDVNTAKLTRKDATVKLKLVVTATEEELSKKITVSDEPSYIAGVSLGGWGISSQTNTEIDYSSFTATQVDASYQLYWYDKSVWVYDQYGQQITAGEITVTISNITESDSALTHMADSFTVNKNGSTQTSITGAEIGDSFTLTVSADGEAEASTTITLGGDGNAYLNSDDSEEGDYTFRQEYLGYTR